jgi:MFS family permease
VRIPSSLAWRTPLIIQAVLGIALAMSCLALPEPPRWLLHNGKPTEARAALDRLGYQLGEAEQFLLLPSSDSQNTSLSALQSLRLIFRKGYRARTMLALFILSAVQLSGIDGVMYYAPTLFAQAGLSGQQASFLASGLSAILMFAVSIPAFLFADKWGRRFSILSGGLSLSFCMLVIGSLYAAGSVHTYGAARWVVIILVFWFSMTYTATWGPISKVYASEIQPANTRATANCIAQGLNFFANWFVALITPILLSKSAYGAYFIFGGLALGTVGLLALYMPETRGQSLESIQDAFQRPVMLSWKENLKNLMSIGKRQTEEQPANGNNISLVSLHAALAEGQNMAASIDTVARGLRVSTS